MSAQAPSFVPRRVRWLAAGYLALAVSAHAYALETVNSVSLVASAVSAPSCLRYRVVGACFYLVCGFFNCRVRVRVKVAHFNPDLVVSTYNSLSGSADPVGGNPWTEAKLITGSAEAGAASVLSTALGGIAGWLPGGGNLSHGSQQNLIFKEADAIGHPLASALNQLAPLSLGLLCPSDATSFKPYFLSGFDVLAWRWGVPESIYPQALVPGLREVGQFPAYTWGALYPRTGSLTQADEAKMAAVIAQRAGDVVTRSGQPHVYRPLGNGQDGFRRHFSRGTMVWSPGKLQENVASGGWWQMTSPALEHSCHIFGENDLATAAGWGGGRIARTGNYTFTLWRPYQCCRGGGLFLGSVDFANNIPPANPSLGTVLSPGGLGGILGSPSPGAGLLRLPSLPNLPRFTLP
ncbi:MAG: TIGR03756 family integrating conjugative element protein [Candidatus Paceibacterota bacterium]|jgi:integrating conjugative element protein (TIGR03756 family)